MGFVATGCQSTNTHKPFRIIMKPNRSDIDTFIQRFYSFYDSVIRKIEIKFRNSSQATSVEILISTRDMQTKENGGWVNVLLRIEEVSAFNFCENTKESYQVLSDGLKIGNGDVEVLYFDFGYFDDLPKDSEKLKSSKFYVIGKDFAWEVREYTP